MYEVIVRDIHAKSKLFFKFYFTFFKAGLSQRKTAHILGRSERVMRYYLVKTDDPNYRPMPYTVQFAIECLAKNE